MKPRAVVITIEAESDETITFLKEFARISLSADTKVLTVRQVKVQVVQAVKAG